MASAQDLTTRLEGKRFGVVGVGNALKGDDGAGSALIERLAAAGAAFPFVDAAEVPENYGGWVEKRRLEAVVFVDAVVMGGAPGEWRIVPVEDLMRSASNTHRLSLHFTVQYLREMWRGEALLIGIEPKSMQLGEGLSPEVAAAVQSIADALLSLKA
jgi:hydrogenase maturation protease